MDALHTAMKAAGRELVPLDWSIDYCRSQMCYTYIPGQWTKHDAAAAVK